MGAIYSVASSALCNRTYLRSLKVGCTALTHFGAVLTMPTPNHPGLSQSEREGLKLTGLRATCWQLPSSIATSSTRAKPIAHFLIFAENVLGWMPWWIWVICDYFRVGGSVLGVANVVLIVANVAAQDLRRYDNFCGLRRILELFSISTLDPSNWSPLTSPLPIWIFRVLKFLYDCRSQAILLIEDFVIRGCGCWDIADSILGVEMKLFFELRDAGSSQAHPLSRPHH